MNWLAIGVGAVGSFALSMLWFGPLYGKVWEAGSHGILRPERPPALALAVYAVAIGCLAIVIGYTATINALGTAIAAILAAALFLFAGGLFSQKSIGASAIDGGSVVAMGAVMILVQAIF